MFSMDHHFVHKTVSCSNTNLCLFLLQYWSMFEQNIVTCLRAKPRLDFGYFQARFICHPLYHHCFYVQSNCMYQSDEGAHNLAYSTIKRFKRRCNDELGKLAAPNIWYNLYYTTYMYACMVACRICMEREKTHRVIGRNSIKLYILRKNGNGKPEKRKRKP